MTAVAVFRNPDTIPFCLTIDLLLNVLFSWLLVHLPSTFFLDNKTKVAPVIIGATGTISKSFRKYVSNIPGNHEVKELQKTAILGTAHILRKVLT